MAAEFDIEYDAEVDAAYIALVPSEPGIVDHSVECAVRDDLTPIVLDVTADGRLAGIEILHASSYLSSALMRHLSARDES
ncbi:MAG: DUF2283 domain-containing protein [Microbacterium sp.]